MPPRIGVVASTGRKSIRMIHALRVDVKSCRVIKNLISSNECDALVDLYCEDNIFRSRVLMEQHGFGLGEYKYFNYPLPDIITSLRTRIYPHLAPIANQWNKMMNIIDVIYPEKHADFIVRCHDAGQLKATPLLLKYGEDDYYILYHCTTFMRKFIILFFNFSQFFIIQLIGRLNSTTASIFLSRLSEQIDEYIIRRFLDASRYKEWTCYT